MATLIIIVSVIGAMMVSGLGIYLANLLTKDRDKLADETIFTNWMPQYTNGFSDGIIVKFHRGEKRTGVEFKPVDLDYVSRLTSREKDIRKLNVENQIVYIENRKLIPFSKGTWSGERNKLWGLPKNPEDLPEQLKDSWIGKILMNLVKEINVKVTEIDSIREETDRTKKIIEKLGGGEATIAELERVGELYDTSLKALSKSDNKPTSFGLNKPGV